MYEDDNDQAEQLFSIIDLDGSGYIDQSELAHICGDLPPDDAMYIVHICLFKKIKKK
jgi:Ca2+-binding EF-hand superfamily protein